MLGMVSVINIPAILSQQFHNVCKSRAKPVGCAVLFCAPINTT